MREMSVRVGHAAGRYDATQANAARQTRGRGQGDEGGEESESGREERERACSTSDVDSDVGIESEGGWK